MAANVSMEERYIASMVLSGAGDALGYKNGSWEFSKQGQAIHDELESLGGLEKIEVRLPGWMVSDDTVMHLATAEALVDHGTDQDMAKLYSLFARNYKNCMGDMDGRAPGNTCKKYAPFLKPNVKEGYRIDFNQGGGSGCGAAMRAMCIGLRYPRANELSDLISVSVESGRMTHHNPTGYLGSLATALFVSYAVQEKPLKEWGHGLLETLKKARQYITDAGVFVSENLGAWDYFENTWKKYLVQRKIQDGISEAVFPEEYGVAERDKFYKSVSHSGWGGSSGHDAPMIAYDALLGAGDNWTELCKRAMFHCGDSDSTGVIAAACFGAMYGFKGVPERNYKELEYRDRLEKAARGIYRLSHSGQT